MSVKQKPWIGAFNLQVIKKYDRSLHPLRCGPCCSLFCLPSNTVFLIHSFIQSFVCLFLHFVCHFSSSLTRCNGENHIFIYSSSVSELNQNEYDGTAFDEHYWKIGSNESERRLELLLSILLKIGFPTFAACKRINEKCFNSNGAESARGVKESTNDSSNKIIK